MGLQQFQFQYLLYYFNDFSPLYQGNWNLIFFAMFFYREQLVHRLSHLSTTDWCSLPQVTNWCVLSSLYSSFFTSPFLNFSWMHAYSFYIGQLEWSALYVKKHTLQLAVYDIICYLKKNDILVYFVCMYFL